MLYCIEVSVDAIRKTVLGQKPDLSKIRVCSSVGFIHVPKKKRRTKLSPNSEPGLLLVFAHLSPGYRFLHLRTGTIVEAQDVIFREDITVNKLYLNALLNGQHGQYEQIPFVQLPVEYVAEDAVREGAQREIAGSLTGDVTLSHEGLAASAGMLGSGGATSSSSDESDVEVIHNNRATGHGAVAAHGSARSPSPRRPLTRRQRRGNAAPSAPTRVSSRIRRPNVRLSDYQLMVEEETVVEPTTVEAALKSPQRARWLEALHSE
ncbi:hypothetical protein ON010_g17601 [Phytophthora cinnamomi]|nr:hypothetical protein ON010_g17601 [Phytophthora cinnamomi]